MTVDDHPLTESAPAPPVTFTPRARRWSLRRRHQRPPKPRLRKLRFLLVLVGFALIAVISLLFGILTSVASDLPQLENQAQFHESVNSYLYDDQGRPIGVLAPPNQRVLDTWKQISPNMVHAIIAVEDKRFWSSSGIDLRSLARAAVADVTGGATQGASTIPEEFVKNVLAQEDNRTIFEKIREAALAFQLVHHWKKTTILREYLNTIYFGNGAYGVEAAARVYFGWAHGFQPGATNAPPSSCGDPDAQDPKREKCAQVLTPAQAALLAGMVANPWAFDPVLHPVASLGRRNQVLRLMFQQRYLNRTQFEQALSAPLPTKAQIQQPEEPAAAPYFTAWVRPQIIHALEKEGVPAKTASYIAYYGDLKIKLTIDLKLQEAAQNAIDSYFPPGSNGPTAALVAIDNHTGEVRAMVSGGGQFEQSPFNLATLGYRQPGSSFKVFTLAPALMSGEYSPDSIIDSRPVKIPYSTGHGIAIFQPHNDNNAYSGPISLATATAVSDNSVYSQVGMHIGTRRIAQVAHAMGIRSPISTNPAMIIGGLQHGVSTLDMAHAYETIATGGLKVWNPILGDVDGGPIGIHAIDGCTPCAEQNIVNHPDLQRVLPAGVAATMKSILEGVVSSGTATNAAIPGVVVAGKTGTTSNYVDAWFVGWTPQITTAVWVGYPNHVVPMTTQYNGQPVLGGTFPALIWRAFEQTALQILTTESAGMPTTVTTPVSPVLPQDTTPSSGGSSATGATGSTGAANGTNAPAANTGAAGAGTAGGGTAGGGTAGTAGGTAGGGTAGGGTAGGGTAGGGTAGGTAGGGTAGGGTAGGGTAGGGTAGGGTAGGGSAGGGSSGGAGLGGG